MATSLISTGVQFPDNSIQTTAASAIGLVLVATTTATPNSSTMAIESGFTTTYANYVLIFNVACEENQGTITVEIAMGGTYQSGMQYVSQRIGSNETTFLTSSTSTSTMVLTSDLGGSVSGTKAGTIVMYFANATSTTNTKTWSWQGSAPANLNPPGQCVINGGGGIDSTAAISGVRVSCFSRLIRNGTMRLYAYANS